MSKYNWLAVGAFVLGAGVVLAGGEGTAQADSGPSPDASSQSSQPGGTRLSVTGRIARPSGHPNASAVHPAGALRNRAARVTAGSPGDQLARQVSASATIGFNPGPFLGLFGNGVDASATCTAGTSACNGGDGGLIWGDGGHGANGGTGGSAGWFGNGGQGGDAVIGGGDGGTGGSGGLISGNGGAGGRGGAGTTALAAGNGGSGGGVGLLNLFGRGGAGGDGGISGPGGLSGSGGVGGRGGIFAAAGPTGVPGAVGTNFVYVANNLSTSVAVISRPTNTVIGVIPIPDIFTSDVALSPDGRWVYATSSHYPVGILAAIDTGTMSVADTVSVDNPGAIAPAPTGDVLYVASHDAVSVLDTRTMTVVRAIPVGADPISDLALTPNGRYLYLATVPVESFGASLNGAVSVIDTVTNTLIVPAIPVGKHPSGVAIAPDGRIVYVTNFYSNTVSVISTDTNAVVDTIAVGEYPYGVAVSPDGHTVYVANNTSTAQGTVSLISTATNSVVDTISVGGAPIGITVSPDGTLVYVTGSADGTVSVISTATNTVTDVLPFNDFQNPTSVVAGGLV